jgi:hypothetical protein
MSISHIGRPFAPSRPARAHAGSFASSLDDFESFLVDSSSPFADDARARVARRPRRAIADDARRARGALGGARDVDVARIVVDECRTRRRERRERFECRKRPGRPSRARALT